MGRGGFLVCLLFPPLRLGLVFRFCRKGNRIGFRHFFGGDGVLVPIEQGLLNLGF